MEKRGILVPLVLAVLSAVVYLMALSSRERAVFRTLENRTVLVARVDIPERTLLTEELVSQQTVPQKFVLQDGFEIRTPSDVKLISNLVTRIRIPKGNPIAKSALTSLSPTAGLGVKVPPGYRGITIPVEQDMLRLIKPGDRLDVVVTFDALMADNRKEKVTATILQNVLVLGVASDLGQGMTAQQFGEKAKDDQQGAAFSEKGAVSVALNPNEVQYLALAQKQGDILVSVRAVGDSEMHPIPMASFRALFKS